MNKIVGAFAYLFGKVQASEDNGVVVVVAFWFGHYFVLAETHLTPRALDGARCACRKWHSSYIGLLCRQCGTRIAPRQ